LRASGREWMTVVTGPLFSIVTVMDLLLPLPLAGGGDHRS
jgi:hypothetical protein